MMTDTPKTDARELNPRDSLILNLSGWIERRAVDIGSYADVIIHGVKAYETEISNLRAERDALQAKLDVMEDALSKISVRMELTGDELQQVARQALSAIKEGE